MAAISLSLAFNIDLTEPDVYDGDPNGFFGYKVLQVTSDKSKGIIVTAPLSGAGEICRQWNKQATCFTPQDVSVGATTVPVKHFGLSLAKHPTRSEFTVCSPTVVTECNENSYMNSVCYKMTDQLQQISNFTPNFEDCTKKMVNLVFLFDGSQSMLENEFNKNKEFIVDVMESLKNTSIKFAAVQFSSDTRTVFTFNDYTEGKAHTLLKKEKHMRRLTNTYSALKFVLEQHFENTKSGASPEATKVLVVITDGDPTESDTGIVDIYDSKKIIRFVIGVKQVSLDKVKTIASEPKDKNAFQIENYDGLTGVLENFQKKIFLTEGSTAALAGDLKEEMSQTGFSSVFNKDTLILGSVGSNTWRGSLHERRQQRETHIKDPQMEEDSYMGYSVSVGERQKVSLYFAGAPRFNHTGQVVLFTAAGNNWTTTQRINGDQIGSYFGAEVCSVDVNSDGNTDFLLVGAPLFYQAQEKREGQIYVYLELMNKLNVTAPSMGRFGTTISSLADLNGDELRDVAVGAPMENENKGAVYIYLGDRRRGIRNTYSQKIMGEKFQPGLRFFGQAIDGSIDLDDDGLPDIVVGSRGSAVVLRSRPVFNVVAHLSFEPNEISTEDFDCVTKSEESFPMITLSVCFVMVETTTSVAGTVSGGLNISYVLDVDPMRQTFRAFFSESDVKSRNFTSTNELRPGETCFNHSIHMPKCVKDTLSPVGIKLNFSQDDSETAAAVLNIDSKGQALVEVPFEKKCRTNDICISELEVDFNFMTPVLLVAERNYFNVTMRLSNHGDDAYNTSLTMHYPPGLSFSMMSLAKVNITPLHSCDDLDVLDKTICRISRPVYRSNSHATFVTDFLIMTNYEWNDTVSLTVSANSDNPNSTRASVTKTIPVQFEIQMAVIKAEDTVSYLNFTLEDSAPKTVVTKYKVDNRGWKSFPVNVTLFFPTKLEHDFEMNNYQVIVEKEMTNYCSPERKCRFIVCDSFMLDKESDVEFVLSGEVQFKDLKEQAANIPFLKRYTGDGGGVKFKSFIYVTYDKEKYVGESDKQEVCNDPTMSWTEIRIELIIAPDQMLIISTGAGLGLLLLIIITIIMFKVSTGTLSRCPGESAGTHFHQ
uniref:Integrin alpha-M-like n=1 Tax=Sphaeramia orbicularis TaxID=375764 RepID=A0A672YKR3_9TELE